MNRNRLIIGAGAAAGVMLIGLWFVAAGPSERASTPVTYLENPQEFAEYVDLPSVSVLESENYLGQRIRIIEGFVSNTSDRTLRSIELHLTFIGFSGETVLESDEEALQAPLVSGEERQFTFRFEDLPAGWNYRVPAIEIQAIGY